MKDLIVDLTNCIKLGYTKEQSIELLKILEMRDTNKKLQMIYEELYYINKQILEK